MLSARKEVARQLIGSWFANGKDCSLETSDDDRHDRIGRGPASERISQCICCSLGAKNSGTELREGIQGALCCASEKDFKLARWAENMLEIVTRLEISRSMNIIVSIDVARCDTANRWSPLSFIPWRFSRRNDCSLGGRVFSARFVNELAESPDRVKW
jgi:hypothetical protein